MLMGPFNSSSHHHNLHHHDDQDDAHHHPHQDTFTLTGLQTYQPPSSTLTTSPPNSIHTRQLLIRCAHLISLTDFSSAHRLLSILSSTSSRTGDSTERLSHQFVRALSHRLHTSSARPTVSTPASDSILMMMTSPTRRDPISHHYIEESVDQVDFSTSSVEETIKSCYLSLNQITPFIRFSHLTANQAILEAIDEAYQAIHIVDFDIMHGVQWPPLMHALVDRYNNNNALEAPPMLRITATGHDPNFLRKTGDRLSKFAQSLGLRFQFHPVLILNDHDHHLLIPSALNIFPDEALAFNCVFYLHKLMKDDLRLLLHKIKGLNPRVVTVAEREANHNHPLFMERFVETLEHYGAIFDSLEATLPPSSRERMEVEEIWMGREIMDVVGKEGNNRRQRHERYESWEMMLRSLGFSNIALSPFALSQAKLLLRLHYPSEGYQLHVQNDCFFLGWKNRPLFSVSSWH